MQMHFGNVLNRSLRPFEKKWQRVFFIVYVQLIQFKYVAKN